MLLYMIPWRCVLKTKYMIGIKQNSVSITINLHIVNMGTVVFSSTRTDRLIEKEQEATVLQSSTINKRHQLAISRIWNYYHNSALAYSKRIYIAIKTHEKNSFENRAFIIKELWMQQNLCEHRIIKGDLWPRWIRL